MFNTKGIVPSDFERAYRELQSRLRVSGIRDYTPCVIPPDDYDRLKGAIPSIHLFCDSRIEYPHFKLGIYGAIFQRGY